MTTQSKTFGQLFKEARMNRRKTLREVGEYINKAVSYLSDVEHARKGAPDLETVRKIEEFLLITDGRLVSAASKERWSLPPNVIREAQKRRAIADFLMRADEFSDEDIDDFLNRKTQQRGKD